MSFHCKTYDLIGCSRCEKEFDLPAAFPRSSDGKFAARLAMEAAGWRYDFALGGYLISDYCPECLKGIEFQTWPISQLLTEEATANAHAILKSLGLEPPT